jgi:hypothetical protein
MRLAWVHDHHNALAEWKRRELDDWLTDVFEAPSVPLRHKGTKAIRSHARTEFEREGWAINARLDAKHDLSVFALKQELAVHLQTGNMSRALYDLLKLQYLHMSDRIAAAALAMPTKEGAAALNSNVAHADRVASELQLFRHIITVPVLIIAFE